MQFGRRAYLVACHHPRTTALDDSLQEEESLAEGEPAAGRGSKAFLVAKFSVSIPHQLRLAFLFSEVGRCPGHPPTALGTTKGNRPELQARHWLGISTSNSPPQWIACMQVQSQEVLLHSMSGHCMGCSVRLG